MESRLPFNAKFMLNIMYFIRNDDTIIRTDFLFS